MNTEQATALQGIRVVDFSRQLAGPYGTLVLGDFGADVVKIESVPDGDPSRNTGQYYIGHESTMFLTWNRNKRSICIDLRQSQGIDIANRLIADADVLVENYRPGVADEIGIGWTAVREINPRLVYVSVTGFGSHGPLAQRPATDPIVQAMSGIMSMTGPRNGEPCLSGIPVADYVTAMLNVQAVLLGLMARTVTGLGQHIEVSMLGSVLFGLTTRVGPYFMNGETPGPFGSEHSQAVPYGAFATLDGTVMAGVWGDRGWPAFCEAVGLPQLVDDPRFVDNVMRVEHRDALIEILRKQFSTRTNADWEERLVSRGVLFTPVNTLPQTLADPQVAAMGLVTEVNHPTAGSLKQIAQPIQMAETPAVIRHPPPRLGEHTREILLEAGVSEVDIDTLISSGAVKSLTSA